MRKDRIMADHSVSDDTLKFKPWRDVWRVHPDADRMPMASADEQEQLKLDIEHSGMLQPIEFLIGGDYEPEDEAAGERIAMLDGRNRLDALHRLGYRFAHPVGRGPLMREPDGEVEELFCRYVHENEVPFPFERVVSLNITRRHLTTAQKREVIAALLQDMPELSNRELARKVGADDKTVGTMRRHLEELGQLLPQEVTIGHDNRVRTTRRRAPVRPAERPDTVKVEKDRLVRLAATRYAQDSGDLFSWAKDGPQKIAHVLVEDGCAQSSLVKVQQVFQAGLNEAKRLEKQAREAQRAARPEER
jgi:hypothetical protein